MRYLIPLVVLLLAVLLLWWFWPRPVPESETGSVESGPQTTLPRPAETPTTPALPTGEGAMAIELPDLNDSDAFVRERLEVWPLPESWASQDELVRRLAVLVDNAAKGEYPRRQLGFMAPNGAFAVRTEGEREYIDPAGYARYDRYLDMLERIDPAALAGTLATIEPLVSQALAELGNEAGPDQQIERAVAQLRAVPVLTEPVELVRPKVFYEYADPKLERLTPLQKQVLRMGPDNVRRLQDWLARFTEVRGS
jgi:hypothetical protein